MSLRPRPPRRSRPLTHDSAKGKLVRSQATISDLRQTIADLEQKIADEEERVRYLQRAIWRFEQKLDEEVTAEDIDADPLFRIRFPDHTTI